MNLNKKIQTLRGSKRLTLEETSKLLGVSLNIYVNFENGRTEPKYSQLLKMSEVFQVHPSEFFEGDAWKTEDPTRNDLYLVKYKTPIEKRWYGTEVFVNGVWMCREIEKWQEINRL